jgi:FMN phosphatase YigB (HAD superfamily)
VLRHLPGLGVVAYPQAFAAGQLGPRCRRPNYPQPGRVPPSARPLVKPFPDVPDVPGVLERLRADGVQMAVVSDNWPGLEGLYRQLGLPPHQCVFVDDASDLVAAAIELGYGGTAIIRSSDPPTDVPWTSTLEDLVSMTGS